MAPNFQRADASSHAYELQHKSTSLGGDLAGAGGTRVSDQRAGIRTVDVSQRPHGPATYGPAVRQAPRRSHAREPGASSNVRAGVPLPQPRLALAVQALAFSPLYTPVPGIRWFSRGAMADAALVPAPAPKRPRLEQQLVAADSRALAGLEAGAVPRTSSLDAPTMLLTGHGAAVFSVKISPQGNVLASGSSDKAVFLWNVRGDCQVRPLNRAPA